MSAEDSSNAPDWFARALAAQGESRFVEISGCQIHYLRWGDPQRPGLMFFPASGGHAHWFAHLAPMFADQFCVVAMDPAGCGDSGQRETYTHDAMIAEIMGVCEDAGMMQADAKPVILGHSAGAQQVVRAAIANDDKLLGVIALDGLRYDPNMAKDHALVKLAEPRPEPRAPKVYAEFEDAIARFRLTPEPRIPIGNEFIIQNIGRHSFRQVEGGWTSKYDPRQGALVSLAFELTGQLKNLKCRAASIYCEHTHLADERAADVVSAMNDGKITTFRIPGASHYPYIDNPLGFVATIKGVALTWLAETKRA